MDKQQLRTAAKRLEREAARKAHNKARLAFLAKRVNDPQTVSTYLAAKGWRA